MVLLKYRTPYNDRTIDTKDKTPIAHATLELTDQALAGNEHIALPWAESPCRVVRVKKTQKGPFGLLGRRLPLLQ